MRLLSTAYKKTFLTLLTFSFLLTSVSASSPFDSGKMNKMDKEELEKALAKSLVRMLLHRNGTKRALGRFGIYGDEAMRMSSYIKRSWDALNFGQGQPQLTDLENVFRALPQNGLDAEKRLRLEEILIKDQNEVTPAELMDAVNILIYMANRYGKGVNTILACASCVSEDLGRSGLKYTLETVDDAYAKKVLIEVLPYGPKKLKRFIKINMRRQGLGTYARNVIGSEEERSLGLFLGLELQGSRDHRNLINAVKDFSTNAAGEVKLLNPSNPHKFWKLFDDDLSSVELQGWTKLLRKVAADARSKGEVNKQAAFFRYLEAKVKKDPALAGRYRTIKENNCFFNN
jgi:hypothetical protein